MTGLFADLLRQRVRLRGGEPLLTYYDLGSGERTELSGTSFLNWVDKTSNLLVDDLLFEPGAVVDLRLARTAPGHWVTLVVAAAAWQVGALIRVAGEPAPAELLVLGPDWAGEDRSAAEAVLACSLHPLGLGFPEPLPDDVMDFSLEVRGQADVHLPGPRSGSEPAWVDDRRALTQADLTTPSQPQSTGSRRLVRPSDPWTTVREALLVPVRTGGSAVVVVGEDPARIARIAETERVERFES